MSKSVLSHHSFFGIRLPFRPVNQLIERINDITEDNSTNHNLLLRTLLEQPWADESLFLASPALHAAWQPLKNQSVEIETPLANALWRYIFRSYGRSTPYGLFAGMGVGTIGSDRCIEIGDYPWQTLSRPDITALTAISRSLTDDDAIRPQLRYRLNNSAYEVAGDFRFSEQIETSLKPRIVLSSLTSTPDLRTLVEYLREKGEVSYSELSTLYGVEFQDEVSAYLDALISNQFLVSNLTIPITGLDMATNLLTQLHKLGTEPAVNKLLLEAKRLLDCSSISLSNLAHAQRLVGVTLSRLNNSVEVPDSLIQTDIFFHPARLQLDSHTVMKIADQYSDLLPILHHTQPSPLEDFVRRFREQYDNQEVELLMALDPEVGVGFTMDALSMYSLLNELPFPPAVNPPPALNTHERLRELLYSRYVMNGRSEVELTEADINKVAKLIPKPSLPPSWYLHGELFTPKPQSDIEKKANTDQSESGSSQGWRFVVNSTIGASSAFFFGRFCHGHKPLREAVETMCTWEQAQYPTDILAEIVHLPSSPLRAGNVVARPILRPFEIPYLTPAGVSESHTIFLSDLLISVTAKGDVVLRTKKTGQRVRPRLSTAHNSSLGDEVYQLLACLHQTEYSALGWSWGSLSQLPSLPRLVYRNLIISPAQWTVRKDVMHPDHPLTIESIRKLYFLPRYVQFIEGDNKLLLDLDFEPARKILIDAVRKQDKIVLKEWLGENYQPWLTNLDNQYVSELVIPMKTLSLQNLHMSKAESGMIQPVTDRGGVVQRSFIPGQDWLYLKIYVHEQVADQILINILVPLSKQALNKGWLVNMHFVRYADPDSHLRIRFQIQNSKHGKLLTAWNQALKLYTQSGQVKRVQLDTYERELERYRPALIEYCETIFSADSQFLLNWLTTQGDLQPEEDRYRLALLSADALLNDFGFQLAEKVEFSRRLQEVFFQEQDGTKELKRKLNELYRDRHQEFFDHPSINVNLINERSRNLKSAVGSIQAYFSQTPHDTGHDQLVASLLHMAMNRIFQGQHRRHELIVYHFLARHYESGLARLKK